MKYDDLKFTRIRVRFKVHEILRALNNTNFRVVILGRYYKSDPLENYTIKVMSFTRH